MTELLTSGENVELKLLFPKCLLVIPSYQGGSLESPIRDVYREHPCMRLVERKQDCATNSVSLTGDLAHLPVNERTVRV